MEEHLKLFISHYDNFLSILIDADECPKALLADRERYRLFKRRVSEVKRLDMETKLFIAYLKHIKAIN